MTSLELIQLILQLFILFTQMFHSVPIIIMLLVQLIQFLIILLLLLLTITINFIHTISLNNPSPPSPSPTLVPVSISHILNIPTSIRNLVPNSLDRVPITSSLKHMASYHIHIDSLVSCPIAQSCDPCSHVSSQLSPVSCCNPQSCCNLPSCQCSDTP